MHGSLTERITRSLAYMLRHQPEDFDLELDEQGFGEIGDVVCALNERLGEPIEEEDLMTAIEGGDRARYEVLDGSIRALYGHSIQVEAGESCEPPELLYVGVGSRDARRAEEHGLQGGRRTYLHLATTFEDAKETGRRVARNYCVITVYALDAWEDGIQFYDRKSLFLSDPIPTEYIEVGETFDDGFEPMRRGGRGMRGRDGGRGPRGRRGGGGGGRPGGRGRGFEQRAFDEGEQPARERVDTRREQEEEPAAQKREQRAPAESRERNSRPRKSAQAAPSEQQAEPAKRTRNEPKAAPAASPDFGLGIFQEPEVSEKSAVEPIIELPVEPSREADVDAARSEQPQEINEESGGDEQESVGGFGAGIVGG